MATIVTPDGTELYGVSRGKGTPILFVHGWLSSHRTWDRQVYALQDRYRCVAFDLRGMGQSEKPDCAYSFEEFASDLHHLIKTLELSDVTLVGRSMGVSVSLSYMERYQGEGDVNRIVLVNGPIKLINSEDWQFGMDEAKAMGYINQIASDPINGRREFARACLNNPTEAQVDSTFSIFLQTPLDVAIKAVKNQIHLDHRAVLKSLSIPCLAIQSGRDFYPIALGEYIAETVPQGRLKVFPNSGHSLGPQDAEAFNRALTNFIEETSGGTPEVPP